MTRPVVLRQPARRKDNILPQRKDKKEGAETFDVFNVARRSGSLPVFRSKRAGVSEEGLVDLMASGIDRHYLTTPLRARQLPHNSGKQQVAGNL